MNHLVQKSCSLGLTALMMLATTVPVLAESMWVPRLGYPSSGIKRVYLDVLPTDVKRAEAKAQREESKEARKARKEAEKAAKAEAKEQRRAEKEQRKATKEEREAQLTSITAKPSPDQTLSEKELNKMTREARREAQRKQMAIERGDRIKARYEAMEAKKNNAPVSGAYFLFDLKQDRMLFRESANLREGTGLSISPSVGPYYVEFSETGTRDGLYDLAVRGSGHRSERPIWVSDTVYWDALKPVLEDVNKTHCPPQEGRFQILHQCFYVETIAKEAAGSPDPKIKTVQGGWYTDNDALQSIGILKDTTEIANITQMLTQLYALNPQSFKYIQFPGEAYTQSRYADILDEANWGLKYLLTIQNNDGSFPGAIQQSQTGKNPSWLLPASPESTARGVMALATAVRVFKTEDLSLAVKYMRAAEKGWNYLAKHTTDAESMALASGALMQVSDKPQYAEAYASAKSQAGVISGQTALLLGSLAKDFTLETDSLNTGALQVPAALPLVAQVQAKTPGAKEALGQWTSDLFGYEKITLVRDPNLELVSAWVDPLQWMATKTGEVATRVSQKLSDNGVLGNTIGLNDEKLKVLEEKENQVRTRAVEGYKTLNLRTLDKVNLAYALALLNQETQPAYDPTETKEIVRRRQYTPDYSGVKGYFPNPLGGRQPYQK